jgi:hypothetical protein
MGKQEKYKAKEDTRDIFDKALDSGYVNGPTSLIGGMLVGGLAGRAFRKAKKLAGRKVYGDEGFKGAMAGGMAGLPVGYVGETRSEERKKRRK